MSNILTEAHIVNTTSGISYTPYVLSQVELQLLSEGQANVQVPDGYYIGIEVDFSESIVCSGIRFFTTDSSASLFDVKVASHEREPDGYKNSNYNYATAKMFNDNSPYPFKARSQNPPFSSYDAYRAFDEDETTSWAPASSSLPVRLVIDFGEPIIINKYRFQESTSIPRTPKSWTIQVPASGVGNPSISEASDWMDIDSRSGIAAPGTYKWTDFFKFHNENAYSKYAFNVTEVQTAGSLPSVANLKLVEADYNWELLNPSWLGSFYEYSFSPSPVRKARFFYVNDSSATQTVSGIQFFNVEDVVTISGSGVTDNYQIGFTSDYSSIQIKNTGDFAGAAKALLEFTGTFDIDESIAISKGNEEYAWVGLDNFYNVPEVYNWASGVSSNLSNILNTLMIADGQTQGSWTSPIIDVDEDFTRAYVYGDGDISIKVRASDTPPAKLGFLIITTEYTHETLMYKHKRVYIDSVGSVIAEATCNPPTGGKKPWRYSNSSFTGKPLRFWGSINSRGKAAFLAPGLTTCGDIGFEAEAASYENWYRLCTSTLVSDSSWNSGDNVENLYWGPNQEVVFTKTFPMNDSDGFFTFVISNDTDLNVIQVAIAFQDGNDTRVGTGIITVENANLTGDDVCDVIEDVGNNSWWVYIGGDVNRIYKTDIGSIQSTCSFYWVVIVSGRTGRIETSKLYEGYNYYMNVDESLKKLVPIPYSGFAGFWAFDDTNIYLYEETFELGEVVVNLRRTISSSTIDSTPFTELHAGSCDNEGNLWVVDLDQERVLRCNLSKALNSENTDLFDYDASGNNVEGVISVWAHPSDGSAYILVSDSTDFPGEDIIRKIHFSQLPDSDSAFICEVPGFASSTYKYGVSFSGCDFGNFIMSSDENYYWKDNSVIPWQDYISGRWLPTGRYKQFRITLERNSSIDPSPILRHIRLPKPLELGVLDRQEEKEIIVKTDFEGVDSYGTYAASVDVWWEDKR